MPKNGGDYQLWELIDVSDQNYPNTFYIKNVATSQYLTSQTMYVYAEPEVETLPVSAVPLDTNEDKNYLKWTRDGNKFKSVATDTYLTGLLDKVLLGTITSSITDWILQ